MEEEILWHKNFDLDVVHTPVDVEMFKKLLTEAKYPQEKINFIYEGFSEGFHLHYQGSRNVRLESENLKLRVGSKTELWNKLMKEVKEKRIAGPYEKIPFEDNYIQSPIGLVPKDGGKMTRLIFHLSHPGGGETSVNSCIEGVR